MKLLAVSQAYLPAMRAGSELSLHYLLRYMQRRGHDVCFHNTDSRLAYSYDGVQVVQQWDTPDVVLAQLDASWARRYADLAGVPLVYWAHTIWDPPHGDLYIANTDHLLARSGRTDGVILHEPVDPAEYRCPPAPHRRAITRIGLSAEKGAHLFWQLTEGLPEHRFLGVCGAWGDQIVHPPPPNTEVWGVQEDMCRVWQQTRILIMPSDEHETYGRVGVEAMLNGIPVIASREPGIVEALDIAGRYADRTNMTKYRDLIRELDDPDAYAEAAGLAQDRGEWLWQRSELELRRAAEAIEALA